jgi:hypothetical protein
MNPTMLGARMTHVVEPADPSPSQDPDEAEPDLGQPDARHARRGKVLAAAAASAWCAMSVIALTVGRPELTAVQHAVQRTTGIPAFPPMILPGILPGILPVIGPPGAAPPSPSQAPAVHEGIVTRHGNPVQAPGATAPGVGAPGSNGPGPQPTAYPSTTSEYTTPPASHAGYPTGTVPASPPTIVPSTIPVPTPTPVPTSYPTPTPTSYPTSAPAVASCLASAADASSVLGALASCAP